MKSLSLTLLSWLLLSCTTACTTTPCPKSMANRCLLGDGDACFYQGNSVFQSLSKSNNKKTGEQIKKDAAHWFELGCQKKHQLSCKEWKNYRAYLKK